MEALRWAHLQIGPDDARSWRTARFSVLAAGRWNDLLDGDDTGWDQPGRAEQWIEHGFTVDQVSTLGWASLDPYEVMEPWTQEGFGPDQIMDWHSIGVFNATAAQALRDSAPIEVFGVDGHINLQYFADNDIALS